MINTELDTPEQRWAEAEALLNNTLDDDVRRRVSRRRTRLLLVFAGLMILLPAIGFAIACFTGGLDDSGSDSGSSSPHWAQIVGLSLDIVGFVLVVLAMVRLARSVSHPEQAPTAR